ncbi:collagen alpha-1(XII) chain [Aplysia californica]|uniref:Collagen alpha-1(XII) chain n=1 Tax=Aplysia californica TaxID=6500 RepID=A0ABM1VSM1_APLCA|nr:collagen alpha-1(XII) chain [Aplysia californica]
MRTSVCAVLLLLALAAKPEPVSSDDDCEHVRLDVALVVDSSSSVTRANFKKTMRFIDTILRQLPIGPDDVRVAIIRFSHGSDVMTYFNDNMDKDSKRKAIKKMRFNGGTTATDKAIKDLREKVLDSSHGNRENVPDLVVLITDGTSNDVTATVREASFLKQRPNLRVVTLGIGPFVNRDEVSKLASSTGEMYEARSFKALAQGSFAEKILQSACLPQYRVPPEDRTRAPHGGSSLITVTKREDNHTTMKPSAAGAHEKTATEEESPSQTTTTTQASSSKPTTATTTITTTMTSTQPTSPPPTTTTPPTTTSPAAPQPPAPRPSPPRPAPPPPPPADTPPRPRPQRSASTPPGVT